MLSACARGKLIGQDEYFGNCFYLRLKRGGSERGEYGLPIVK